MRKLLTLAIVLLSAFALFFGLPSLIDWQMNSVAQSPPYPANSTAKALHERLFVADLHNDALLWQRDLLTRHSYGHSDLPRLLEGRVALQVFSTVTKTPRGLNYHSNAADSDNITLLLMAQRWPRQTWNSLLQRALYQAERLQQSAKASQGRLVLIHSRGELQAYLDSWQRNPNQLGALLATEGLHPLEGRLENLDKLYDAGFRIAGLTHFFDNEVGGSAHGLTKGGLTPLGHQVIQRLEAHGMLVDLAHASEQLIDDVLAVAHKPVLVSHTGVAGTCPGPRNLSDRHIRRIAKNGGLIGIGYWDAAVCDASVNAIIRAIRYTVDRVGVEHVALGSDFNGTVHAPFDSTGLVQITEGLQQAGFTPEQIAALMGGNVRDLLLDSLPE